MAKLRCPHGSRVHVLTNAIVVHRDDGSKCAAQILNIAGKHVTPTRVVKGNTVDLFTKE